MYASSVRRRVWLSVLVPVALLVLASGQGCPSSVNVDVHNPPVVIAEPPGTVVVVEADAFGIDLINDTVLEVDPGVSVDEFLLDLGTLEPLEGSDVPVPFDIDCFPGDTLTIDPVLFLPGGVDVLAANGPVVIEEGIDYICGDIITLNFVQDNTGTFFVDVFVNGDLIN